jgi:hypothetical protein
MQHRQVNAMSQSEVEALKKELALARAEIELLRLQLSNTMLLLKGEMTKSGTLTRPKQ